jgi:hypothetical protein
MIDPGLAALFLFESSHKIFYKVIFNDCLFIKNVNTEQMLVISGVVKRQAAEVFLY